MTNTRMMLVQDLNGNGPGRSREAAAVLEPGPPLVEDLEGLGPALEYPSGEILARQALMAREVYFLERGLVKLKRFEEGGRRMVVGLRTPGWLLGASAAVLRRPYPATMETVTRCRLRLMKADQFRELLKTNTRLSWYLTVLQSQEVYDHVAQVSCLAYSSNL
ncbi:MAG: cyclic nucleotide-binding domain-containing protein [Acidobacteria bacterium]|nr:cyclic nucleotide-binding domain-containing protein [Acidobacteriota bacterium]